MHNPVPRALRRTDPDPARGAGRARGIRIALVLALAAVGSACSPALNWREIRPAGTALTLQMPCKPAQQQRRVALAGPPVVLSLLACTADEITWALAHADVGDPARVGPALRELRDSSLGNFGGGAASDRGPQVAGATPRPEAARIAFDGRLPDGKAVQVQVAVFAQGTRVYEATALGERLPGDAAHTFFASMRLSAP